MQLRNMNDEAEAGLHLDASGRHTEAFQVQYAQIVLELKQARAPCIHLASLQADHRYMLEVVRWSLTWREYAPILLSQKGRLVVPFLLSCEATAPVMCIAGIACSCNLLGLTEGMTAADQ